MTTKTSTILDQVHALHESQKKLAAQTQELERRLARVMARGTREFNGPMTVKVVVDYRTDATALQTRIAELIDDNPMTFQQIFAALPDAGENRIKSALTWLKYNKHRMLNLGDGQRGIWVLPGRKTRAELMRKSAAAAERWTR